MTNQLAAAATWWNNSLQETGIQGMERRLDPAAGWETVLESGREDLAPAIELASMTTGNDRAVLDIGCGVGRMSQALSHHFGKVVGVDVAETLLQLARERNTNPRVTFEQGDGWTILPGLRETFDAAFSYEVLYIIEPRTVANYFQDVVRLLRPGGEFVFQMNLQPLKWRTRLSYQVRNFLYACGVKHWRGWPTAPGFQRHAYSREWLTQALQAAGFVVEAIVGDSLTQTWIRARKPA